MQRMFIKPSKQLKCHAYKTRKGYFFIFFKFNKLKTKPLLSPHKRNRAKNHKTSKYEHLWCKQDQFSAKTHANTSIYYQKLPTTLEVDLILSICF